MTVAMGVLLGVLLIAAIWDDGLRLAAVAVGLVGAAVVIALS